MRRLVGIGGLVSLGGLVGVAAHRVANTEYPWSRPGATASTILQDPQWPEDFPITSEHLKRLDETSMPHRARTPDRPPDMPATHAFKPRLGQLTRTSTLSRG